MGGMVRIIDEYVPLTWEETIMAKAKLTALECFNDLKTIAFEDKIGLY